MIKLYGKLAKKFGKVLNIRVNSVKEMMKALEANIPGFRSNIDKDKNYVIRRGDTFKTATDVDALEVEMNFADTTWHILPLPRGSGSFGKIILGAILIVIGVVLNVYTGISGTWFINAGIGMVIGGIAGLLAPAPTASNYGDREVANERPSYLFDGPTNRTAAGGAVPLIYGFGAFVGSTFISGGLEIGDIYVAPEVVETVTPTIPAEQNIDYGGRH